MKNKKYVLVMPGKKRREEAKYQKHIKMNESIKLWDFFTKKGREKISKYGSWPESPITYWRLERGRKEVTFLNLDAVFDYMVEEGFEFDGSFRTDWDRPGFIFKAINYKPETPKKKKK